MAKLVGENVAVTEARDCVLLYHTPVPIRVLQVLVTTSRGGPRQVCDLASHLPRDEFQVAMAGPRDGTFFDRFGELGVTMAELPVRRLGVRHLLSTVRLSRALGIRRGRT